MKRILTIVVIIMLIITLTAGCSGGSAPAPDNQKPGDQPAEEQQNTGNQEQNTDDSSMVETIDGEEIVFDDYELVIVRDYNGKYLDQLEKVEFEIGDGSGTYTAAIFGEANNVEFIYGEYQTGGGKVIPVADQVSNSLITFNNAPAGESTYCALYIDGRYKTALAVLDEWTENQGIMVVDSDGKEEYPMEAPVESNEPQPEPGHVMKDTIVNVNYTFMIEEDKSKEVVKGVPVNYLYLQLPGGKKTLIAQSVDKGEDWTNSIAAILNPTMSNDFKKVYYETDNTFTRTNGMGANNHRTRVYDIETGQDSYFAEGGIEYLLNEGYGKYAGYLILKAHTRDDSGQPTFGYPVVTPEGEDLVWLDEYDYLMDIRAAIDAKLAEKNPSQQPDQSSSQTSVDLKIIEIPSEGVDVSSLTETIHGYRIEYNLYQHVIIEDYPQEGIYPFQYAMEFENPAYPENDKIYTIAVMGGIKDVSIRSRTDTNSYLKPYKVADEIKDSLIEIRSSFSSDTAMDELQFKDYSGKSYTVTIDHKGDKAVYATKLPF